MSNVNATLNAQDEIALDDLFAEIDNGLDLVPVAPAIEAVEIESAPVDECEIDELALLVDEIVAEAPKVEIATESDILDDLFDENELDFDALSLEAPSEEVTPAKKPKAKKVKKAQEIPPVEPAIEELADEPAVEDKVAPSVKEKSPTTYRTTYYNSSKSKVLLDRLGGDQSDIVLEFSDAELSDEDLKRKQRAFLSLLNNQPTVNSDGQTVQKKVAEKVIILFTMFKQKKTWNEVMYRTFKLLLTDGYIQSGDKGNLHAELLAKPYSVGTARAQAGQMMQMLPLLKIATETSKGRLEINEDSTIIARLRAEYFADLKAE